MAVLEKLHVLLVEDSRAVALPIQAFIERGGHRVTYASSGEEAVELFRADPPDMVLMDVIMPGISGIEATRLIKAVKLDRWVPLIMMTSLTSDADLINGLDAGADDYLFKPIHFDVLAARMRSMHRIAAIQRTLSDVLGSIIEAIILIDSHGRIISFNTAAENIFGYKASEVVGRNVNMLMPSPTRERHDEYMLKYLATRVSSVVGTKRRVEGVRKNGELFPATLGVTNLVTPEGEIFVGVVRDIGAEETMQRRIEHMAWFDSLTNLPNRAHLYQRLEELIQKSVAAQTGFSLLFLDLDGFKPINDQHGHRVGDEVLRIVGERLRSVLPKRDLLARLGGDEFVVMADGAAKPEHGLQIAERLLTMLARDIVVDEIRCNVSASIGVAVFPAQGADSESLVRAADMAMYAAKQAGGRRAMLAVQVRY